MVVSFRIATIAVACLIISGCARLYWDKYGANLTDRDVALSQCEREAKERVYMGGLAAAYSYDSFHKECMIARGWTIKSTDG